MFVESVQVETLSNNSLVIDSEQRAYAGRIDVALVADDADLPVDRVGIYQRLVTKGPLTLRERGPFQLVLVTSTGLEPVVSRPPPRDRPD